MTTSGRTGKRTSHSGASTSVKCIDDAGAIAAKTTSAMQTSATSLRNNSTGLPESMPGRSRRVKRPRSGCYSFRCRGGVPVGQTNAAAEVPESAVGMERSEHRQQLQEQQRAVLRDERVLQCGECTFELAQTD